MSITMLLDMAADGFGDRVVVGGRKGGLTPTRLRDLALAGATRIRGCGADALIYLAVNGPCFPVAMFAAAYAGVPLVPVNYRLGREQLDALLANHPSALAIAGPEQTDAVGRAGLVVASTQDWLANCAAAVDAGVEPFEAEHSGAPAVIIYTSGTTSAPKGVLLRHENLTSYVFGSVEFAGADPTEAALVSVPPYHIAAVANVITNLFAGRRTVVLEQFTPEQWLDTARAECITNALVVPTMLARVVGSEADKAIPSLRGLAYGGAPMPGRVIENALRIWPDVDFVNAYGLTETSSTIAVLGPDDHRRAIASDDAAVRARIGSVGQVLPGIDLEIRDADDDVLPAGVTGRICVRGEQVSAEYAGVGRMVDDRGFFDTRDHGFLDEGGFLFVGGRVDDTIIRGAENIAPAEIEDVVLRHPDVVDVAVVGVADPDWGQRIEAVVVLRQGADIGPDELRDFVRDSLRSSKTPDRIVYWDELPRTETGKLVRRHVVERLSIQSTVSDPSRIHPTAKAAHERFSMSTETVKATAPAESDAAPEVYTFKDSDIARARDIVGVYHAVTQREQFSRASSDVLRAFARSYGDDNPLFADEDYGLDTRWGSQIAPPMINIAVTKNLLADPIPKEQRRPAFRGIHVFVSGSTTDWYQPLYEGDVLYSFEGFHDVELKESEFAGRSLVVTRIHVEFNQRAEIVQIQKVLTIHTERHESKKRKKYDAISPAAYTPDEIAEIDAIYAAEARRGAESRWWEDVAVGDTLGQMVKGPLTVTDMVVFHSGGYGFAPYTPCTGRLAYQNRQRIGAFYIPNEQGIPDVAQRIHWDAGYAQSIGLPSSYDYGMLRDCWLTHYLTDWVGDDGWIETMSSQMRKFNYLGDTHRFSGEVVGKRVEAGRHLVDLEIRGTSQRGEVTCPATATVSLPSREAGLAGLRTPPADLTAIAARMLKRHGELRAERRSA